MEGSYQVDFNVVHGTSVDLRLGVDFEQNLDGFRRLEEGLQQTRNVRKLDSLLLEYLPKHRHKMQRFEK